MKISTKTDGTEINIELIPETEKEYMFLLSGKFKVKAKLSGERRVLQCPKCGTAKWGIVGLEPDWTNFCKCNEIKNG